MGRIRQKIGALRARPGPQSVKSPKSARGPQRNSVPASSTANSKQHRPLGPLPQASIDDVVATLSTRPFRLFGFAIGPKRQVTDVELRTDVSGLAFGAFARVNGKRVAIEGDLLARLVDRHFAGAQHTAPAAPHKALKSPLAPGPAGPMASTPAARPALVRPSSKPKGPRLSPRAQLSPASSSPRTSSASSLSSAAGDSLWDPGSPSLSVLTPQTSLTHDTDAPAPLTAAQKQAWVRYCERARDPKVFASDAEVFSAAQKLQVTIRVISTYLHRGDRHFYVTDVSPQEGSKLGLLTLHLSDLHYSPIVGDLAAHPELGHDALKGLADAGPEAAHAAFARLTAPGMMARVPGDGSCFYHSLAALTGADAAVLRQDVVQFMVENGEKLTVPDGFGSSTLLARLVD